MRRALAPPLALLALALALSACGGGGQPAGGGQAGGGQPSGGGTTVDMRDNKFVPAAVTVGVGDTVRWTNSDPVPHTVTGEGGPGPAFDSGLIAAGKEFSRAFEQPGKIEYVCTIHPNQTGTVTVR